MIFDLHISLSGEENPDGSTTIAGSITGTIPAPAVVIPPATNTPFLFGVNLSGGENGSPPGLYGNTHTYPEEAEAIYYKAKGFNAIRVPFQWERLQPVLGGPLNAIELDRLILAIDPFLARGMVVIFDPHNYGERLVGGVKHPIGSAAVPTGAFEDFWEKLAVLFKSDPLVWFGLMNEPYRQSAANWAEIAQAATLAIRATGATNKILVPGTAWTGAHSWTDSGNAAAMENFVDPGNNFAFEVHQYLNHDSSGTTMDISPGSGASRLGAVTEWARFGRDKLFLGEFGWTKEPHRLDAFNEGKALLDFINANRDVWIGWAYWAGGPWFSVAETSVEPENPGVDPDHPQMHVLRYAMGLEEWNQPKPQAINLEKSPDLTNWSRQAASAVKTPDGWTRVGDNSENVEHRLEGPIYNVPAGSLIRMELTVKDESRGMIRFGPVAGDPPWQLFRADCDLTDGVVYNLHNLFGGEFQTFDDVPLGGGSYRVSITGRCGQATRVRCGLILLNSSAPDPRVYPGNGSAVLIKDAALYLLPEGS